MISSKQQGDIAEQDALEHLTTAGLVLIEKNFLSKLGEIDLIMSEGSQLVFIEVRYRKSNTYGSALESVNQQKQQRIIKTAQYYLQQNTQSYENYRFDVVAISHNSDKNDINWVKNAFEGF